MLSAPRVLDAPSSSFVGLCAEEFLTPVVAGQPDYSWVDDQDDGVGKPVFSTRGSTLSPTPSVRGQKPIPTPAGEWYGATRPPGAGESEGDGRRRRAFHLRTASQALVGDLHHSLAGCGSVRKTFRPYGSSAPSEPDMAVLAVGKDGRASFGGVHRCGSPWACPCCAPRIAAARAETLKPQVAALMAQGWTAHLITLTVAHAQGDSLDGLWDALGKAWKKLASGKAWDAVRKAGAVESVRGYDVTHGQGAGWHPHVHLALYLGPEHKDPNKVARRVLARWIDCLARQGWMALPGAQHAVRVDDPEAAAAYAVTSAACYEAVAMSLKRGRGKGAGRTPFEILEAAAAGDAQAVVLWREYVEATKGRRQVNTSRGLHLREDEEDEEPVEEQPVAELGQSTVSELYRRRLAAPLLDAVEAALPEGRGEAARSVLRLLDARDWGICCAWCDPPAHGPPGPPERPRWTVPDRRRGEPNAREQVVIRAYEAWREAQLVTS